MSIKWKIYCNEPGDIGWQYEWSDVQITQCPNNPAHSVNPNSVAEVSREIEKIRFSPTFSKTTKGYSFIRLGIFKYDPEIFGNRIRAKFYGEIDGTGSFDIELFDVTNNVSLTMDNFTNEITDELQECSPIDSSLPNSPAIIEINMR